VAGLAQDKHFSALSMQVAQFEEQGMHSPVSESLKKPSLHLMGTHTPSTIISPGTLQTEQVVSEEHFTQLVAQILHKFSFSSRKNPVSQVHVLFKKLKLLLH